MHVELKRTGSQLAQAEVPAQGRYARWIEMYSGKEFANPASWCREVCDEAAADAAEETRTRMQDAFLASSRYELDFWEQAWRCAP